MAIKPTTQIGDPIIRGKSQLVSLSVQQTKTIVKNLIDSMRHNDLVGMAAPQIGMSQRIFVSEIRQTKTRHRDQADPVRVFINPKIISASRKKVFGYEGCGSVAYAGIFGNVKRFQTVDVEALDEKGKKFTLRANGLLARIIQHEIDHLDGKVFLDRMPDAKSLMSRETFLKQRKLQKHITKN